MLVILAILMMLSAVVTAWMGRYPPERFSEIRRWTVAVAASIAGLLSALLFVALV